MRRDFSSDKRESHKGLRCQAISEKFCEKILQQIEIPVDWRRLNDGETHKKDLMLFVTKEKKRNLK